MNTFITLQYADEHNYKKCIECILSGSLTTAQILQIKEKLDEGIYLVANQVGLPTPSELLLGSNFPNESDHAWTSIHEFRFEDEASPSDFATQGVPTVEITANQLYTNIMAVTWNEVNEMERLEAMSLDLSTEPNNEDVVVSKTPTEHVESMSALLERNKHLLLENKCDRDVLAAKICEEINDETTSLAKIMSHPLIDMLNTGINERGNSFFMLNDCDSNNIVFFAPINNDQVIQFAHTPKNYPSIEMSIVNLNREGLISHINVNLTGWQAMKCPYDEVLLDSDSCVYTDE
jgi:hypothetical protein